MTPRGNYMYPRKEATAAAPLGLFCSPVQALSSRTSCWGPTARFWGSGHRTWAQSLWTMRASQFTYAVQWHTGFGAPTSHPHWGFARAVAALSRRPPASLLHRHTGRTGVGSTSQRAPTQCGRTTHTYAAGRIDALHASATVAGPTTDVGPAPGSTRHVGQQGIWFDGWHPRGIHP